MELTEFETCINDYLNYLKLERGLSANSLSAYKIDLEEFRLSCKNKKPKIIKVSDITSYFTNLTKVGRKPATIARKLSSVRHFFRYLTDIKVIDKNPARGYRAPKITRYHPDYLTIQEIEQIIKAAKDSGKDALRNTAIIELLYGCGLRISELATIQIEQVETEAGFVRVIGKGNKQRLVPVGQYALTALEKHLEQSEFHRKYPVAQNIFINRYGKPFSRVGLWKIIRRLVLKASVSKKVTPHTFRHSFATHLLEGGADLRIVQEMLGHADITTTEIYTQIDRDYIIAEHRKHHPRELAGFRNKKSSN